MLLGIPGDDTFSNYQEANRTFWRQTVLPLTQRLVSSLSTWLTPAYGATLRLDIDLDELPALSTERDELWRRIGAATFLTTDEKRAVAGYGAGESDEALEPKFNPGQHRKPTGQPGGGQWTKPGGGGAGNTGAGNDEGAPDLSPFDDSGAGSISEGDEPTTPSIGDSTDKPQDVADRGRYNVDLNEEEQSGHTKRDHVAKTDAELISTVQKQTRYVGPFVVGKLAESSFDSLESANDIVNRTLERHTDQVDAVAQGASNQEILKERFGYKTGRQAFRPTAMDEIIIRPAYDVTVVLRRDSRSPRGYRVFTAYPSNRDVD